MATRAGRARARLTGLSPESQKIASDTEPRKVTDDFYCRIADALLTGTSRMHKVADKVNKMADRIFAELEE